ncbi:TraR/DksA C4-type zinc finger protein [Bacillus sp. REN3]|uniref:TraR/DksA C4-type zinc finger protein n=1 Tax=Bacillus sp. REN3 TaxID=2802440 RepID=UPI001AED2254|nr:TraR/DksA C4-type zinc finger protein [Bacillus sp. REN3]
MLTKVQLNKLKESLIDEKERLLDQVGDEAKEGYLNGSQRDATGDLSAYDNHPADSGTEMFERSKYLAIDGHNDDLLEKIGNALKAMEDGTYGKCAECGRAIPYERLEAVPYTLYCVDHTPEQTLPNDRPAEEEVLELTHNTDFDRRQNEEMTDNKNSFNDVAQFGTSETPADFNTHEEDYNKLYIDEETEGGFTEDYESFSTADLEGKNRRFVYSETEAEYEEMLDDAGIESQLGDIPYRKRDSYIQDKKKEGKKETD